MPLRAVEVQPDGTIRPVRARTDINAALNVCRFGGGIRGFRVPLYILELSLQGNRREERLHQLISVVCSLSKETCFDQTKG
jgi:hypothetical protein